MTLTKVTLVLLLTNAIFLNICAAQTDCPGDCPDTKPPRQPFECPEIAAQGQCGTRITARGRYCGCSCKTCAALAVPSPTPTPPPAGKNDGWTYIDAPKVGTAPTQPAPVPAAPVSFAVKPQQAAIAGISGSGAVSQAFKPQVSSLVSGQQVTASNVPSTELGLAVGGSRGIDNFRRNIENLKLPKESDITYEGVFNDYFFDLSDQTPCNDLFCAKYGGAIATDPLFPSAPKELYIAVGLETGVKLQDFKRKDLDLVIVLDVSGSMGVRFGDFEGMTAADKKLKKIDVAKDAIKKVLNHLNSRDRLAIVTFSSSAKTVLGLTTMNSAGKTNAKNKVNSIGARGLTNLEAGLNRAASLMKQDSRQNRMIVITDAQANRGEYSSAGLANLINNFAKRSDPIFTTMIGVGLDFNTELTDRILQTRGANYFSVYSPTELRNKLDDEFDFMVTPLVYDLKLEIEQRSLVGDNGWKILKAYGVPAEDGGVTAGGTILNVNTLFPSPKSSEGVKGGIILLHVKPKTDSPNPLYIKVSYVDPNFAKYEGSDQITFFTNLQEEFYGTNAIRKAVLLSRYVDMMRFWIFDITPQGKLVVPSYYGDEFALFLIYINDQNKFIQDSSLDRETKILRKLIGLSG